MAPQLRGIDSKNLTCATVLMQGHLDFQKLQVLSSKSNTRRFFSSADDKQMALNRHLRRMRQAAARGASYPNNLDPITHESHYNSNLYERTG